MGEHMNAKKQVWIETAALFMILVLEAVFFHNILFNDQLIGGRIDSKLNTFFIEHWFQVFCGNETWTELDCFYPATHVISYSDMMLGFSFPYILFRMLGMNMYLAMKWTMVFVHAAGSFGMYFLMRRCAKTAVVPAMLSVVAFSLSNSYYFIMVNVQMVYISTLPLLLILVYCYCTHLEQKNRFLYGLAAIALFALQFYTAFYVGYLFALMLMICLPVVLAAMCVGRKQRWCLCILENIKRRWKDGVFFLLCLAVLMMPFVWLYLPTLERTGGRDWAAVAAFIPGIKQALGLAEADKTLMLAQHLDESKFNLTLGIPLVDLLIFGILFFVFLWKYCVKKQKISGGLKALIICLCILVIVSFPLAVQYRGFSPWYLIYHFVPGASAIRAVPRWYNLLTFPLAVVMGLLLQNVLAQGTRNVGKMIAVVFTAVIFCSNHFEGGICSDWSVGEEEVFISNITSPPEDCDIMYLTDTGQTSEKVEGELQMDAWTIAKYFDIHTINGYSGQEPENWEVYVINEDVDKDAEDWLRLNQISDKTVYAYDIGSGEWTRLDYDGVTTSDTTRSAG